MVLSCGQTDAVQAGPFRGGLGLSALSSRKIACQQAGCMTLQARLRHTLQTALPTFLSGAKSAIIFCFSLPKMFSARLTACRAWVVLCCPGSNP